MGPHLARPIVDVVPVDQVVERDDVAVGDVFGLVGLDIEDVGPLARRQSRPQRRVETALLVPGDLDLGAGMALFEILRRLLAQRNLGRLVGLVTPDRDRHILGPCRRDEPNRQHHRCEVPFPECLDHWLQSWLRRMRTNWRRRAPGPSGYASNPGLSKFNSRRHRPGGRRRRRSCLAKPCRLMQG